jgi:pimeloyl-ACP methyl ester carboxylesterase
MGREDIDLEKFRSCGAGAAVAQMMENTVLRPDEHDPASVAYWAKKGMVKEFHGEDKPMDWAEYCSRTGFEYDVSKAYPQNLVKKWTSFVPMSAFKPENKDKKYPLAFVLHGAGNSVYTIDGWGFVDAAIEREWIIIAPSLELDEVILEILEEVKSLYPVDESRVYVCGFSYGSMNTNILSLKHPDVFAAAAPCGGFLTDGMFRPGPRPRRGRPEGAPLMPEYTEPMFLFDGSGMPEKGIKMPAMSVIGNKDGYQFPINESPNREMMVSNLNLWARINGAAEIDPAALEGFSGSSEEENLLGIPLAGGCGAMKHADGIDYAIGDLKDSDGITMVRIVCEDNVPHWPTPELSRLVFEFFSHFSRDPKTHKSVHTK